MTDTLVVDKKNRQLPSLKIGYLPLVDSAPLIIAHENGYFADYDLQVALRRESNWSSLRKRIAERDLDAAQAICSLPILMTLGVDCSPCPTITSLILSLNGDGIILSSRLMKRLATEAGSLRDLVKQIKPRKLVFGIVSYHSPQHLLTRNWLATQGVNPEREAKFVIVPTSQMSPHLKAGHLDGFSAGEPWNTLAALQGMGVCVASSRTIQPNHPGNVLMMRKDWAESNPENHVKMVKALLKACRYCQNPENRPHIADTLALPHYLNLSRKVLMTSLVQATIPPKSELYAGSWQTFYDDLANQPSLDKAAWIIQHLADQQIVNTGEVSINDLGKSVFSMPPYQEAIRQLEREPRVTVPSCSVAA